MRHLLRTLAESIGKGLLAGLVGTAAMTVSSMIEARIRDRGSSTTPADAVESLVHVEPTDETGKARLNNAAHWGYGTALGAPRGLIAMAGLRGPAASAAHLGVVLATENVVLPGLDVSPPAWQWEATEIGIDLLHHTVYAEATSLTYDWLDGSL